MAHLEVNVVSASSTVWRGAATMIVAPAADGEIGILAGHTPLLSLLKAGRVRITPTQGDRVTVSVAGGFLSVDDDQITVVADAAEILTVSE